MNIVLATQSTSVNFLVELASAIQASDASNPESGSIIGGVISDRMQTENFVEAELTCREKKSSWLFEWDVMIEWKTINTEPQILMSELEEQYGDIFHFLRKAFFCDRRFIYPQEATYTEKKVVVQYTDGELIKLAWLALNKTEDLFDKIKPSLALGFICNSFLEYIVYLVSLRRGVAYRNLRSLRFENFVGVFPNVDSYHGLRNPPEKAKYSEVFSANSVVGQYEGAHPISSSSLQLPSNPGRLKLRLIRLVRYLWRSLNRNSFDPHMQRVFKRYFFLKVLNPIRAFKNSRTIDYSDWSVHSRFIYFPLHAEPEVSLLVYGFPFLDQRAVIGIIADSLPLGYTLVVKDHPVMNGRRTPEFFEELRSRKNVALVSPAVSSSEIIERARAVITISSSVAQEAIQLETPVGILGRTVLDDFLHEQGIHPIRDLANLTDSLVKMLEGPAPTKEVLQELHFSIRRFGCRFNLYTDFLERGGKRFPQNERSEQLKSLASYILVSQRGVH